MGKFGKMAKSKNHSSHNQGYKNHRNGIFKVKKERYTSIKMVNQKLNRNTRRARKFDPTIKKNKNYTKKIQARIAKVIKTTTKPKKDDKKKAEAPAKGGKKK